MNALWRRQIRGIFRLETRKILFSFRSLPVYLLAAFPVALGLIVMIAALLLPHENKPFESLAVAAQVFATSYQAIVYFVIYPGCVIVFMNLIRGEVMDRSLHYYFLSPVRREVLLAGKFIAGWLASGALFVGVTLVTLFLFYAIFGFGEAVSYLAGDGFNQVLSYTGMTLMATLGYGSVFLIVGLLFRNPAIPALTILGWEWLNSLLPPPLKQISVVYYLESLRPIPLPRDLIEIVAEPTSPWLAVPGLVVFSAAMLAIAGWRIRSMEIEYGDD